METITPAVVASISQLARVRLQAAEVIEAAEKITAILTHFAAIQNIDTRHIPPADDVTGLRNVWRLDQAESEKLCSHEQLLELAPARHGRHIRVKAIFPQSSPS